MRSVFLVLLGGFLLLLISIVPATADTLSKDEALVAAQIKRLHSPDRRVQADAAAVLRRVVARYPSGTSNLRERDAGKARWGKTLHQIKPGMSRADVLKRIPSATEEISIGSGQTYVVRCRLDNHFRCDIGYENRNDTVIDVTTLTKQENGVGVPPPKHYTGVWNSWYVNGQKLSEIQYTEGKYNGTYTSFHDNGRKSVEQHYTNHRGNGADTGWYPSGKVAYRGQYKNDKQDGTWTHWYENGCKQSETTYRDGVNDGLDTSWYENGQKQREVRYRNGKQNGTETAWDRQGTIEYQHEYKDGQVVEN